MCSGVFCVAVTKSAWVVVCVDEIRQLWISPVINSEDEPRYNILDAIFTCIPNCKSLWLLQAYLYDYYYKYYHLWPLHRTICVS